MYRASPGGLPLLVESVSSDVRAMLALFCYRRSHLHPLAVSIAASCTERELISFRRSRRLDALRAVPRTGGALDLVSLPPQADHAFDQAALDLRPDRGRLR